MSIRAVSEIDYLVPIKNVFCSVTDKKGLADLIKELINIAPELNIFSTGGTFNHLGEALGKSLSSSYLTEVSEYTGVWETEGGLVKSLHHKLFLGYLTETYSVSHQADLKREAAVPIDLVIVNLYDFKSAAKNDGNPKSLELARGNIDVGGPSALRAAAKNWLRVMILPEVSYYESFIENFKKNKGCTTYHMRYDTAIKTFGILSAYDSNIFNFFSSIPADETIKAYTVHSSSGQ